MRIDTFRVLPSVPERLSGLVDLAYNLVWSWDEQLRQVFPRLDRQLWDETYQNPVLMLGQIPQQRLEELAADDGFLAVYDRSVEHLQSYLKEKTWWEKRYPTKPLVAYFSAEFGLAECLPIYSGGLGVLAGHHLKSASDLGVPLVGVGLLYQQGYFRQYLTPDGWQQESYPTNDFFNLPVQPVVSADGTQLRVEVELAGERAQVQVWKVAVGRVPLYLLDTNVPENPPYLRDVTDQLYGGDQETRIRQEIVLGIGGMRVLRAMGLEPDVCHMNEGHSAFLALERIAGAMRTRGLSFAEAFEVARAGAVFTTHTAVPAGFDVFPLPLVDKYFAGFLRDSGISRHQLVALGRSEPDGEQTVFGMAALALRASAYANGVSQIHGAVSRRLLTRYVPNLPAAELPVGHVTNGAHTRSCVSREMAELFDRYLGPDWWRRPGQSESWQGVEAIPDEELWATHERRRERLVAFARQRLARQLAQRGASQREIEHGRGALDTRALTIGFARRFATYKRANLLLADLARLKKILSDVDRPVQILFAGKAHPRDSEAKEVLKSVVAFCQQPDMRRRAVFLEDYDLVVARYMVQGCDVWLNTPRRGEEASGTSGMKVLANGGLNVSILDGWWCEGYSPEVGWAIGRGEEYADHSYQDYVESCALYELLEHDIVPMFYGRGEDRLPRAWIAKMKRSMRNLTWRFSTNRMIWEYGERFYLPAATYAGRMAEDGCRRAREMARWKSAVFRGWGDVRVEEAHALGEGVRRVGEGFGVEARIRLGALAPQDVCVEIQHGGLDAQRQMVAPETAGMQRVGEAGPGVHLYRGEIPCKASGMHGYSVRVRPCHPDANSLLATGLLTWW